MKRGPPRSKRTDTLVPYTTLVRSWRRVQTINVESVFLGCRTALPLMRQSGEGGSIINLSSIQALRPAAELAAYSASKAAVRALTKSVALHAARDRIRCNSVHPGGVHKIGRASCRERVCKYV